MSQKDIMKEWLKELPSEQPSPDFTVKVMQRVMSEWTLNPIKYQPIISRKSWWIIALITILLTSFLFLIHPSISAGAASSTPSNTIYGFNLSQIFAPISHLFEKLNNIIKCRLFQ